MALQFNCQHCNELIISKFLKTGEIAECKKCGEKTTVPQNDEGSSESIIKSEQTISIVNKLSQKYEILDSFKALCYALIFFSTVIFFYNLAKIFEMMETFKKAGFPIDYSILLISIAFWIFSIFSLYCTTLIIGFLFDLDKKTD